MNRLLRAPESQRSRRFETASQLMQLGNIAAGSLLFSQAVAGNQYSILAAGIGVLTISILYAIAQWIMGD